MKKTILSTFISLLVIASLATSGTSYAAGTAAFSLSPASGSKDVNSTFSVGIYENGTAVNVVTANFSYDTSKLQLLGIDASGSAFAADAGTSGTSISRYVPAGGTVSGNAQVAVVTFKAIAGSGSAAVTAGTAGSHIASAGAEQWNGTPVSGSFALNTPAAAPATPTSTPATQKTSTTTKATATVAASSATQPVATTSQTTAPTTTKNASETKAKVLGVSTTSISTTTNHSMRNAAWIAGILAVLAGAAAGYWALFMRKQEAADVTN